jgi:hypothetical protein
MFWFDTCRVHTICSICHIYAGVYCRAEDNVPCRWVTLLPITHEAGTSASSYAVSAILNARLQRAEIAVHDVTWMAEHSAVEGEAGAREGPLPLPPNQCPTRGPMLGSTFHANTFYAEGVGDPTGETPFGTCAALQELLVGTGPDGRIVAFPGFGDGSVSTKLSGKACFNNLRVEGAFLVSGCYHQNATSFVSVLSEAGRLCRVELPSLRLPLAVLLAPGSEVIYAPSYIFL